MKLKDIIRQIKALFEPKRKNPILLDRDSNLESNLKPIKIGGKSTIVDISETELKVRGTIDANAITVNGTSVSTEPDDDGIGITNAVEDRLVSVATATALNGEANLTFDGDILKVTNTDALKTQAQFRYDDSKYLSINVTGFGDTTVATTHDLTFTVHGNCLNFNNGSNTFGEINMASTTLKLISATDYDMALASQGTGDVILTSGSGDITSTSGTASKPEVILSNLTADASAPILTFNSQRGASAVDAVDNDTLGVLYFNGYDDGTPSTQTYGRIRVRAHDVSSGAEKGRISLDTATNDGTLTAGLKLEGTGTAAQVDATLNGTLTLKETADASADTAGYGQLWVHDDTPNTLWFTDDIGTDYQIGPSAGTYLGFTVDGSDAADQTYNLTTSYVVFDSDLSVTFKTPPSEKVEIQATFYYEQGSGGRNVFASLSDNASYGSNTLHHYAQHERAVSNDPLRGGNGIVTVSWYLIAAGLEAIGSSNTIYFAASCDSTAGTPNIKWGGDATDEYQNFVMRAIALPA